ncbi:MAG: hypothetical protein ACI4TV_02870 [Paludibacteraceae bacterium]
MKKCLYITLLALLTIGATSCVSQKNQSNYIIKPDQIRLEVNMSDLQLLGTTTVEMEYKQYGIITKIYTINGQPYNPRNYSTTSLSAKHGSYVGKMEKALYKVHDEFPGADYVMPTFHTKEVQYMQGGGKIIKETIVVKAYKIK